MLVWLRRGFNFLFCSLLSLFSHAALADAEYQYPRFNMHRGVTPLSRDIYDLHLTIFGVCVAIGVIVFGVMTYALIRHRKARGVKPSVTHEHTRLEVTWSVTPFIILVIMAIPATIVLKRMNNFEDAELTIKITGQQWKWHYEYLDQGIKFVSSLSTPVSQIQNQAAKGRWYLLEVDNPLVLPVHKKIRFLVTSMDVIHSWWVPALGVKRDAVPGFIHEAWAYIDTPGTYRGQCAELCGTNHGFMPIVVIAQSEKDFQNWVAVQRRKQGEAGALKKLPFDQLMKLGQATYEKYCVACHQATGLGIPGVYPALKGSPVATGKPIARHIDTVLQGVAGTAMQAFSNQLTDVELATVITYERNAWGNNTKDAVQPIDIQAERDRLQKGGKSLGVVKGQ